MIRPLSWLSALGLLIPVAAGAQQQVEVGEGEVIPNLRPCVDYVGRGALHSTGSELLSSPDDMFGNGVYRYRFTERSELYGHSRWTAQRLVQGGHALADLHISDAAVFLGRSGRFVGWSRIWKDRAGRPFLPIFSWPDSKRRTGWAPLAIRAYARPVFYDARQPDWSDGGRDEEEDVDLYVRRGRRWFVRYGLYLSDIPPLFRAAQEETCWR